MEEGRGEASGRRRGEGGGKGEVGRGVDEEKGGDGRATKGGNSVLNSFRNVHRYLVSRITSPHQVHA